jgi:hypothetical protein
MPIPEAILNQLKCCLSNDGHVAIEPILVSCGSSVCKKCVIDSKDEAIKCLSCKENHKKSDLTRGPINKVASSMVQTFLNDLFEYVETATQKCSASIKGILIKNLNTNQNF